MDRPEIKADMAADPSGEMARALRSSGSEQSCVGFVDSGLPEGDPLPPLPDGCFALTPLEEASEPVVRAMREFRPHVMLPIRERRLPAPRPHQDPPGQRRSYEAAADADSYPESGEPWQLLKMYYFVSFHGAKFVALHEEMLPRGLESPTPRSSRSGRSAPKSAGGGTSTELEITTQVPCGDFFEVRDEALKAHATQVDPAGFWFRCPLDVQQAAWPTEDYHLARSVVDSDLPEDDLFTGIRERVRL